MNIVQGCTERCLLGHNVNESTCINVFSSAVLLIIEFRILIDEVKLILKTRNLD